LKLAIICRPFVFYGGLERATAGLVSELVQRGVDVHLLTTRRQLHWPGATIHHLPVLATPSLARLVSFAFAARHAARTGGYDVVQSHERTWGHDLYRAGEGCHRAWLRIRSAYLPARARWVVRLNPYHRLLLAMERSIFTPGHYRKLVAISRFSRDEICRLYPVPPEDVVVIYNGVDLVRFTPANRARHRRAVREEFGISESARLALFVGSGFERKGLDTLILALAQVKERTLRLAVVGKGNTETYRALAARLHVDDRIHWIGAVPDVERFYGAADLVCLPTRYDPFGNVYLEALASGLAVIASPRSGGAEIVTHGRDGFVLRDPDDSKELADAIDAFADPARGRQLEHAARQNAERFTYAAQVDQFLALYREVGRPS